MSTVSFFLRKGSPANARRTGSTKLRSSTGYATDTWHAKADLQSLVDEVQAYRVSVAEDTAGKLADLERERLSLDHKIAVQRQKATAATAITNAQ
ncbi:hypothetical protein RvY_19178 [Ramazzottius varieornatus]|uniref:Uncharacterized protein n=1 Tax=Ramazzottius varieornatus TaxID=947166 RepID=A0A1D1WAM8_RAMVA|nr:hypothetical protein RvY_19178 [Ramazzottius varieornatus]